MSYQVIARKYRPQRFSDVVGQEHVTQTLSNAIQQKRIAHAYLFCGPRGTGKTTIARIFAKCLRCKNAPTIEPCNECSECKAISAGNSMDMLEFDAASNTQVEKIRDIIIDHVRYAPSSGAVKLYLIDEVHMLSNSSFNALLKTLEEPPAHVKFLFATTDPEKLPPTILSRCQRFDLRRIPTALITEHLTAISKQEKVEIDEAALYAIARGADGGMRDAECTLDQLISFCGNKVEESDVLSMFGLTAQSQILALAEAILNGDSETALREFNGLAKGGKDLARLLSDLLNHFRNLLIFQVSKGDMKLLEVSETEAATLSKQSALISADGLTRVMEILTDGESRLRDAASKKIFIEVVLLKAIDARNAVSIDTVLKQLQQLRSGSGGGTPISSIPTAAAAPAPRTERVAPAPIAPAPKNPPVAQTAAAAPTPAAAPVVHSGGDIDLRSLWDQLIAAVGRVSPFVLNYLKDAHPVSLVKNVFTIGYDPEYADALGLVDNSRNHQLLSTKLHELGYGNCQVKFIKSEAPAGWARPVEIAAPAPPPEPVATPATAPAAAKTAEAPAAAAQPVASAKPKTESIPFNKDDFKNDPLIQKALEIFKGQIVDVRA